MGDGEIWGRWRYERLLACAGKNRLAGRIYARVVASVELRRDPDRRRTAVERIARWRRASAAESLRIYRASLVSEAQEEADSIRFMNDDAAFTRWQPAALAIPLVDAPVVFASLHLGSPVLGFLALRGCCALDVRAIVRGLNDSNPMTSPKRRWGARKVAWLRERSAGGIFGVDPFDTAASREHLLGGGALFAALDVPGDVAARNTVVDLGGEQLRFSSGILRLAQLTTSTIVPMVALGRRTRMKIVFGAPIAATSATDPAPAVFRELARFIDRFPDEWWLWPFVQPAERR